MIMIVITMMMGMLTMTCSECGDRVDDYNQVNDNDPYCDDDMCICDDDMHIVQVLNTGNMIILTRWAMMMIMICVLVQLLNTWRA